MKAKRVWCQIISLALMLSLFGTATAVTAYAEEIPVSVHFCLDTGMQKVLFE